MVGVQQPGSVVSAPSQPVDGVRGWCGRQMQGQGAAGEESSPESRIVELEGKLLAEQAKVADLDLQVRMGPAAPCPESRHGHPIAYQVLYCCRCVR